MDSDADETERWQALARLKDGKGTMEDLQAFAEDYREHHLNPNEAHITTRLWLDIVMENAVNGSAAPQAFGATRKRGAPPRNNELRIRVTAFIELQLRSGVTKTEAIARAAEEFHKDIRNIEKAFLGRLSNNLRNDQLTRLMAPRR